MPRAIRHDSPFKADSTVKGKTYPGEKNCQMTGAQGGKGASVTAGFGGTKKSFPDEGDQKKTSPRQESELSVK